MTERDLDKIRRQRKRERSCVCVGVGVGCVCVGCVCVSFSGKRKRWFWVSDGCWLNGIFFLGLFICHFFLSFLSLSSSILILCLCLSKKLKFFYVCVLSIYKECILIIFVNLPSELESLAKPNKLLNKLISLHSIILDGEVSRKLIEKQIGKLNQHFQLF